MMNPSTLRRLERLEARVDAYVAERDQKLLERFINKMLDGLHKFAAIALFGEPKPDEPLSQAWQRCLEKLPPSAKVDRNAPHKLQDWEVVDILDRAIPREGLLSLESPDERLQRALSGAPPWLVAFTGADLAAMMLNLSVPTGGEDLTPGAEAVKEMMRWPEFPQGAFLAGDPVKPDESEKAQEIISNRFVGFALKSIANRASRRASRKI